MCGIVGVVGVQNATHDLLFTLKKLEYRGYDSTGISLFNRGEIKTVKTKGKIIELENKVQQYHFDDNQIGIGHTRWATHGDVSDINSHPHVTPQVSIVHNGIIENYLSLKQQLLDEGVEFRSSTDSEVMVHLLDRYISSGMTPLETLQKIDYMLEGSYALGIMFQNTPECIYALRHGSPLVIGLGSDKQYLSSDPSALLSYTKDFIILEDGQCARLESDVVRVYDVKTLDRIDHQIVTFDMSEDVAEKGGYPHFMLKEINEQPDVFSRAIAPHIQNKKINLSIKNELKDIERVYIVGCGTAYHAGLILKQALLEISELPSEIYIASEFRYNPPLFSPNSLVIVLSQSGETADTLAALKLAQEKGLKTLAIVNVAGSSIERAADLVLHLNAQLEISVASTKAYFAMGVVSLLLAYQFAQIKGKEIDLHHFLETKDVVQKILKQEIDFKSLAQQFKDVQHCFYIGRGIDYINAQEASLKLKEISYIHSEAYPAGELKHGSLALIHEGSWVIGLCSDPLLVDKTLSNLKEVKARLSNVLVFTTLDPQLFSDVSQQVIQIPSSNSPLIDSLNMAVVTQLFAYHVASARGCEIDQPRNLAKSVTVE